MFSNSVFVVDGLLDVKNINAVLDNVYNFPITQGQKHILVYRIGGDLLYERNKSLVSFKKHLNEF
jgi:hypothetical protein